MYASNGSRLFLLSIAGVLGLAAPAAAQSTDFAMCAGNTTDCSASTSSCCKSPFSPAGTQKAIIIPLDRCHQPYGTGADAPSGPGAPLTLVGYNTGNGWCVDSPGTDSVRIGGTAADDGMFKAYGLVYRLMQRSIPVYWLVNSTKQPPALTAAQNLAAQTYIASDVDFWVLGNGVAAPPNSVTGLSDCLIASGCTQPVHRLDRTTLAPKTDSYRKKEFPVRGSAFLIAPENRAAFEAFWTRSGVYAGLSATKYGWETSGIDLYEVDASARLVFQNFNSGAGTASSPYALIEGAPVAVKIDHAPPRIARVGQNNAVATAWLAKAGLDDPATAASCPTGEFVPSDATYCNVSDAQIQAGVLISGAFEWAWVDDYDYGGSPCSTPAQLAMFDKLRDFMTAIPGLRNAGHSLYLSKSINISEGCDNKQILGKQGTGGLAVSTGTPPPEPYILRYPANLLGQWGDVPTSFASGGVSSWTYATSDATVGYSALFTGAGSSSLRRIATFDATATAGNPTCTGHLSTTICDKFTPASTAGDITDVAAYGRFANNLINGIALYVGGNQLATSGTSLRIVLGSLIALPDETVTTTPVETEISRSTPIVAELSGANYVFQGTYTNQSPTPSVTKAITSATLSRFKFPYVTGHLRMIPIETYTAARKTFTQIAATAVFDAANYIPPVSASGCTTNFNSSCRTVFTTTAGGLRPDHVMFTTGNVSQLGPIMASNFTTAERETLISRVLAGHPDGSGGYVAKLGGVDRSTVAVIGTSPLAGGARPTMAYFGATDGMLHAVCVEAGNGCDRPGRELWAFIPRKLLPTLRHNIAHIDGSPRVIDAYGDFYGTGVRGWKTILIFQMGSGAMTSLATAPAVYAIDITTPRSPRVLWEYSVTSVTSRAAFELGVGLTIAAGPVDIAGTMTNLAVAQTNNGGTGGAGSVTTAINLETGVRVWQHGVAAPAPRNTSYEPVPLSGVPGGAVGIDKLGINKFTDFVIGTLYGDVWQLAADTGIPRHGTTTPLFRASTDYHPIGVPATIFSKGGTLYAAFATGGYYDTSPTLWRGSNLSPAPTQYAFAVSLAKTTAGSVNENSGAPLVPTKIDFGSGEGGFAQVMVIGTELFITTDNSNVNLFDYGISGALSGKVYRWDTATNAASTGPVVIAGGAASMSAQGTKVLSGTAGFGERLADAAGTTGTNVSTIATGSTKLLRKLWLRTE